MKEVQVKWNLASPEEVYFRRCLYAYTLTEEIIYIGKADKMSVKGRFSGYHKQKLAQRLIDLNVPITSMMVLVGDMEYEGNFSSTLLNQVESLLIYRVQPVGNVRNTKSAWLREDLVVRCRGDWTLSQKTFKVK